MRDWRFMRKRFLKKIKRNNPKMQTLLKIVVKGVIPVPIHRDKPVYDS